MWIKGKGEGWVIVGGFGGRLEGINRKGGGSRPVCRFERSRKREYSLPWQEKSSR